MTSGNGGGQSPSNPSGSGNQGSPGQPPDQSSNPPNQQNSAGQPQGGQPASQQQSSPDFMPPPPPASMKKKPAAGGFQMIAQALNPDNMRTLLDLDACRQVVSNLMSEKEEELEELKKRPGVAPKPCPIENYKTASPCKSKWVDMAGTDQFRVCEACLAHVYDVDGMDLEEVKKLVYQREAIDKPKYFRRRDGRFMTQDCPVGVRGKVTLAVLAVAGVLLVAGLIALLVMWKPPAPEPTVTQAQKEAQPAEKSTAAGQTSGQGQVSGGDDGGWMQLTDDAQSSGTPTGYDGGKSGTNPPVTGYPQSSSFPAQTDLPSTPAGSHIEPGVSYQGIQYGQDQPSQEGTSKER